MRSSMFKAGSPKNVSPPSPSSVNSPRCMAPMLALETRPYSVLNSAACSPTYWSMERRSFMSSSSKPLSSAILNVMVSAPDWVSLRFKSLLRRSGPISDIVVRTGCPCSPYISQNVTGNASGEWSVIFSNFTRSSTFALPPPSRHMPERSPFTSAINTGTPSRLNCSARVWSVTVFPVPVAPAIRPCLLAIPESMPISLSAFAITISVPVFAITPPLNTSCYYQSADSHWTLDPASVLETWSTCGNSSLISSTCDIIKICRYISLRYSRAFIISRRLSRS